MLKTDKRTKLIFFFFLALIFLFFLVFFSYIHPIIVSDTDDWHHVYFHRDAVPNLNNWNPARVFPEVLMPLASEFAAYFLKPIAALFGKGIFETLTFSYAIAVSASLVFLVYILIKYLFDLKCNNFTIICISLFFLLCLFWIFRSKTSDNNYMLKSNDACTYFYYVIPNILNCAAVLIIKKYFNSSKTTSKSLITQSMLTILIYYCVFSNIFASVIISVFSGVILLDALITDIVNKQFIFKKFVFNNIVLIIIIILWFVSQVFEINGRRAGSVATFSPNNIIICAKSLFHLVDKMNLFFLIQSIVIVVLGLALSLASKNEKMIHEITIYFISFLFIALYLILSCSVVGIDYIERSNVFFGLFFFGMLILIQCLIVIINRFPKILFMVPLILTIIFFNIDTEGKTFQESYATGIGIVEPWQAYAIDYDITNQVKSATKNGESSVDIIVPEFDSTDNWPYPEKYAADRLVAMLYKLGEIDYPITCNGLHPSINKNIELRIPLPY